MDSTELFAVGVGGTTMNLSLEDKLRAAYSKDFKLLAIHMDLIYSCDLDCCHCYLDDKRTDALSTEEILGVLAQARELGALKLTLSGGELFLRKDLFEILEFARASRFYIKLKTHGGLLTEEAADKLATLGINRVDFSVYSLEEDVHDFITRRTGSLERTMEGLERLVARGIPVRVNCSVMNLNTRSYKDLYRYFAERGIDASIDGSIRGTNGGGVETYVLGLTVEEKVEMERFKREMLGTLPKPVTMDPEEHICWAGKTSAHIQPDGTVTPCVAWPMSLGSVRDQSLRSIWEEEETLKEIRDMRRKDLTGCSGCVLQTKCTFCPGKAYVENEGAWKEPFSLQCQDTAARTFGTLSYNASKVLGEDGENSKEAWTFKSSNDNRHLNPIVEPIQWNEPQLPQEKRRPRLRSLIQTQGIQLTRKNDR